MKSAKQRPTLAERMKCARGIVTSGVPDLASNPKHLEGFGRDAGRRARVGKAKLPEKRKRSR